MASNSFVGDENLSSSSWMLRGNRGGLASGSKQQPGDSHYKTVGLGVETTENTNGAAGTSISGRKQQPGDSHDRTFGLGVETTENTNGATATGASISKRDRRYSTPDEKDPKKLKKIMKNRESTQRSRLKKVDEKAASDKLIIELQDKISLLQGQLSSLTEGFTDKVSGLTGQVSYITNKVVQMETIIYAQAQKIQELEQLSSAQGLPNDPNTLNKQLVMQEGVVMENVQPNNQQFSFLGLLYEQINKQYLPSQPENSFDNLDDANSNDPALNSENGINGLAKNGCLAGNPIGFGNNAATMAASDSVSVGGGANNFGTNLYVPNLVGGGGSSSSDTNVSDDFNFVFSDIIHDIPELVTATGDF